MRIRCSTLLIVAAMPACGTPARPAPAGPVAHVVEPVAAPKVIASSRLPSLARAPITGRAVVDARVTLHATAAAARDDGETYEPLATVSARVVRDLGDTVELETIGDERDCITAHRLGYALRVHVPRTALVPRVARPLRAGFADGTAWVLDVGAPVLPYDDGVIRPVDRLLAAARATAPGDAVALGVTPLAERAVLPASPGTRATCPDPGDPISAECGLATAGGEPALAIDGVAAIDPQQVGFQRDYQINRIGTGYLISIRATCGELRAAAGAANVGSAYGGIGTGRGPRTQTYYEAVPGAPVTWKDGTPAGHYVGDRTFLEPELRRDGDRVCVTLEGVDEELCHRAADLRSITP